MPEGLTNEGAANLASHIDNSEAVKRLAGNKGDSGNVDRAQHEDSQSGRSSTKDEGQKEGDEPAQGKKKGEEKNKKVASGRKSDSKHKGGKRGTAKKGGAGSEKKAAEPGRANGDRAVKPGSDDGAKASKDDGAFDIDFIAREYAIHEQWAGLPPGRDLVMKEYTAEQVRDAGSAGPTLTLEQRRALLNKAIGGGIASGMAQFGLGLAMQCWPKPMARSSVSIAQGKRLSAR